MCIVMFFWYLKYASKTMKQNFNFTCKIYINVSHEMWEFPVLSEKIDVKTYL